MVVLVNEFAKLGKADIVQKLEERGGPEARKLFEKFMRDVEKLQAEQEQAQAWLSQYAQAKYRLSPQQADRLAALVVQVM